MSPRVLILGAQAFFTVSFLPIHFSPAREPMQNESVKTAATDAVRQQVDRAFEAARSGQFELSSALAEEGASVVPAVASYLKDSSETLRAQAVAVLRLISSADVLAPLAMALDDASPDIQKRAALALYERVDLAGSGEPAFGSALVRSVKGGNDSAAAVLLLGYVPGEVTLATIRELQKQPAEAKTELFPWSPVVPVALAATVAGSRLGDAGARRVLLETIETDGLDELRFLLVVLREIDAPEVLHALKKTLADSRTVSGGVPSGAEPRRRLQDEAVNAFVSRLALKVGFELSTSRRYPDQAFAEVREKIGAAIPR